MHCYKLLFIIMHSKKERLIVKRPSRFAVALFPSISRILNGNNLVIFPDLPSLIWALNLRLHLREEHNRTQRLQSGKLSCIRIKSRQLYGKLWVVPTTAFFPLYFSMRMKRPNGASVSKPISRFSEAIGPLIIRYQSHRDVLPGAGKEAADANAACCTIYWQCRGWTCRVVRD